MDSIKLPTITTRLVGGDRIETSKMIYNFSDESVCFSLSFPYFDYKRCSGFKTDGKSVCHKLERRLLYKSQSIGMNLPD